MRQPRRSLASSPGLISQRVTQRKQQKCWEGERFTKAGCRGLWDAVRTCAVACSGARLMMLLAKRGLRCPDSRLFRDPSSPGWLPARPKTPGGAKRRVFFQKHNPHDRAKRCLLDIRLEHRCTRRPRAKHASHELALSFPSIGSQGWHWLLASTRRHRRAGRSVWNRCRSHRVARCISLL